MADKDIQEVHRRLNSAQEHLAQAAIDLNESGKFSDLRDYILRTRLKITKAMTDFTFYKEESDK